MEGAASDRAWRENVYRGDGTPQLTARALVTGALLGALMGVSNLYVGLKVGWSLGVVVTASVGGWGVWHVAHRLGWTRTRASTLELNAMASTASAAGYSTGTTLASAVAAHLMVTGVLVDAWVLFGWILSVSLLGLCIAIPLKRQLIDREALPFPSGAAAAETIRGLVAEGAARPARVLLAAIGVGAGVKVVVGILPTVVEATGLPTFLALPPLIPSAGMVAALPWLGAFSALTFGVELSLLFPAAGAFVGLRVGWSMLLGGVACFGLLAPAMHTRGLIATLDYQGIVAWSLWPGTTLLVVGGVVPLLLRWRSLTRVVGDWRLAIPGQDVDIPSRWAASGFLLATIGCVGVARLGFGIPVGWGLAAVGLAVVLATVAARVTGETDVTPTGPLAKVAQLTLGSGLGTNIGANVMGAGISAGAAASAADLLTDLKSGRVLGANPRLQFVAQFVGVLVGAACVVPTFRYLLAQHADALGTAAWPAPAARAWALVATLVTDPTWSASPGLRWSIGVAAGAAILLVVVPHLWPRACAWTPSPIGLGLAFILPASSSIGIFAGAAVVAVLMRRFTAETMGPRLFSIAAGLIAGESIAGVVAALVTTARS